MKKRKKIFIQKSDLTLKEKIIDVVFVIALSILFYIVIFATLNILY